ncbi:Hydroxyacid oxidase 1, partial [Stegodyphus mimosarum]
MDVSSGELKTVSDFEKAALDRCLDGVGKIYFSAGANSLSTPKDNEEALKSYKIVPRMLRDVAGANLECQILGNGMCSPIGVSPTGCLFLAHPQAEVAAVRGCLKEGCIFILSCLSSTTLEEVANITREVEGNQAVLWLQLYIFRNRSLTLNLVKKAEELNFSAIVVSVDSPIGGLWKNVMPQNFLDILKSKLLNIPG